MCALVLGGYHLHVNKGLYDTTLTNTSSRLQCATVKASSANSRFIASRRRKSCDAGARQPIATVNTPGMSTTVENEGSSAETAFCKAGASAEKRNVTL